MFEKFSRIIFLILSFILIFLGINQIGKTLLVEGILVIGYGVMINPYVLSNVLKKFGVQTIDFSYFFKRLLLVMGVFVAYGIANLIFLKLSIENITLENYESIFRILVYIIYLIILFMFKNDNKTYKYIIFGLFYCGCTILSFSSSMINNIIIEMLNWVPQGNVDTETFKILVNDFFVPIKESILTYIIFDTIIEAKNDDRNSNRKGEDFVEENKNMSFENHIIVENEKIVLENITSNIELETEKLSISIKQK